MVIETPRLQLRRLTVEDAPFIFQLVNEPSWLRFIGDKNVRTLDGARGYILNGPIASYKTLGYGLYLTLLKESGAPAGICGLLKRDSLADPDIGFAFLPAYWGQGYAREAAAAVLAHAQSDLGLRRLLAVTNPDNHGSIKLLETLGWNYERRVLLVGGGAELSLYVRELQD